MAPRIAVLVLLLLLVAIQAQMWFGRGSVPSVTGLQHQLNAQKAANAKAQQTNDQLASEIEDLKTGLGMVEEKARMELGMVKPDEIFVQVVPAESGAPQALSSPAANRP